MMSSKLHNGPAEMKKKRSEPQDLTNPPSEEAPEPVYPPPSPPRARSTSYTTTSPSTPPPQTPYNPSQRRPNSRTTSTTNPNTCDPFNTDTDRICIRLEHAFDVRQPNSFYTVSKWWTVAQFVYTVRKGLKLGPSIAVFLMVGDPPQLVNNAGLVAQLPKGPDGWVRIRWIEESTFG